MENSGKLDDIATGSVNDRKGRPLLAKIIKEYNFFVYNAHQHNNNQREPPTSTTDIINYEMAIFENPVTENRITMPICNTNEYFVTPTKDQSNDKVHKIFRKMKDRLIQEDASDYFDASGDTVFHSTPLCPKSISQFMLRNDLINVTYVRPEISDNYMDLNHGSHLKNICLIDIKLVNLSFKHHHLYSLEHLLAECIKETFIDYDNQITKNVISKIEKDLKMARKGREKIICELKKLHKSKEDIYLDGTVVEYNNRVMDLKEKYIDECKKRADIIDKLIILWGDIKKVRKEAQSVKTTVTIDITEENKAENYVNDTLNEMYENELLDELHNIEYFFAKDLSEYRIKKKQLKNSNKKCGENYKLIKPHINLDEDKIKKRIDDILEVISPKNFEIFLKLQYQDDMVAMDNYEIATYKYHLEIYLDDAPICKSENFNINNNFNVQLSDSFAVQILPSNKKLIITLVENDLEISNIALELNNIKENPMILKQFITKQNVGVGKFTVGSGNTLKDICNKMGISLKSIDIIKDKFFTKGELTMLIGWSNSPREIQNINVKNYIEESKKINEILSKNTFDFKCLNYIIRKICDSKEEIDIYVAISDKLKKVLDKTQFYIQCTTFGNLDDENNRFKLLHYRENEKQFELKNDVVPLLPSQISAEQLHCLTNESLEENYDPAKYSTLEMEPVDLKRYLGEKYMRIANKRLQKNLEHNMFEKSYENVVRDNHAGNCRFLFNIISKRKIEVPNNMHLNHSGMYSVHAIIFRAFCLPDRISEKDSLTNNFTKEEEGFSLKQLRPFVRVSYKDVNERTGTAIGNNPSWNQILNLNIRSSVLSVINVNVYDEVKEDLLDRYDEDQYENKVHYRLSHRWLGSLQIPLISVQSHSKIQGAVKINTPPVILGYHNSNETGNNLLNLLHDPIQSMQKEGAFITLSIKIEPHVQTSINRSASLLHTSNDNFMFKHISDFLINYSKEFPSRILYLTYFSSNGQQKCVTQFLQAIPLPDIELLQKDLRTHTRRESAMSKSSSSRSVDGGRNGNDDRGDSANTQRSSEMGNIERDSTQNTFEMKSLRKDGVQLENIIHACARYVSLIPLYESMHPYEITLSGLELLQILHGSPLDHTILLASYLLYLGVKCWIIAGMGLPRGFSHYVLVFHDTATNKLQLTTDYESKYRTFSMIKQNNNIPLIYDAATGTRYDMRDACSPLKTIHYVYNDENIWINVQLMDSCDSVRLDFKRTSDWQTVFNKNVYLSKLSAVTEQNLYAAPINVDSLKQKIENKIKVKIQKWRTSHRTIWNRYCGSVLKESLPNWEYWTLNPNTTKPGPSNRLKQLMSTYKIYGFPLNFQYTNMKRILSSIKSTTFFLNEDPTVEFGVAVEVFSYPGAVLSVWIYLASITRN